MNSNPLPAPQANDHWYLHDWHTALLEPGDVQPSLACLQRDSLQLGAILVTRHYPRHSDTAACCGQPGSTRGKRIADAPIHIRQPEMRKIAEPGNLELIHYMQRWDELRAQRLPHAPSRRVPCCVQTQGREQQVPAALFAAGRQRGNEFR
jgi:hypothetical protein